jgi:hypothetical protein
MRGSAGRPLGGDQASHRPTVSELLEGEWRLERLSGALPPLTLMRARKEIWGDRGKTRFGPFPGVSFRVEEREDCLALVYRAPFSVLVDEVTRKSDGSWLGEATLGGRAFGRFRMTRIS